MIDKDIEALVDRINNYLGNGGLFNPELMEHDKVSELIIDCREAFTALLKEAHAGNEAVVMGYGNYAVGCCKDPETDIEGVIYLPLSEPREVGADTSDLFPIGSSQEGYKALIYFKDSKAIQQTIEYLQSISYYKPPTQEVEALKAKLNPRMWTKEMSDAWHKNLPDTQKAFEALAAIDNTNELQEPNTWSE